MKLLVGLGNKGPEYAKTRHNFGFILIDELLKEFSLPMCRFNAKFSAELVEASLSEEKLILVKPMTMMNLSGQAVRKLVDFYKLSAKDVWVAYDDIDLPFGTLRVRSGGGSGGHNGVASIIEHLGSEFARVRLGIANEHSTETDTAKFVLSDFTKTEQTRLSKVLKETVNILNIQLSEVPKDTTYTLTQ